MNDNVIIKNKNVFSKIDVSNILYFTNVEIRSEFFTYKNENYVLEKSLLKIEKEFNQDYFFRVHCNYIVNLNFTSEIIFLPRPVIKLINNKIIPISERRIPLLLKKTKKFFEYKVHEDCYV